MISLDNTADTRVVDSEFAAVFLGVDHTVLRIWRYRKIGPPYIVMPKQGRVCTPVRYRICDLEAYQKRVDIREEKLPGKLPGPRPGPVRGWKKRRAEALKSD
jgi:hypothetical protein